jgi:hypothetical protein
VLAHTISQVAAAPFTNTGAGRLEVNGFLPPRVVAASQIG